MIFIAIIATLIICGGSLALGALSAPTGQPQREVSTSPSKQQLAERLETERPTILTVLTSAYPKSQTDYIIGSEALYGKGEWYGAVLTYKGSDMMNRDTLRVLLQKKSGVWILRTTPPELLLSSKKYPDVPKSVLQSINRPVSLPGTDSSPAINQAG